MKKLTTLLLAWIGLAVLPAHGQTPNPSMISFRMVDDLGALVTQGEIKVSTFSHWVPGEGFGHDEYDQRRAPVSEEGKVSFDVANIRGEVGYSAYPSGKYYPVPAQTYRFRQVENGRWEPWNPEVTVTVPRKLNPTALYARRIHATELPTTAPVGFDLMVSDWVAPYGKGKRADFICEVSTVVPMTDPTKAFESVLNITFPSNGDGVSPSRANPKKRLLKLPREAPASGYEPRVTKRLARAAEGAELETGTLEDQNYFFRVRTVLDPQGNVISALYGKIHGDILWDTLNSRSGHLQFTYYLNPTPLDRNLEFDPKRNLFPARLDGTNITEP